MLSSPEQKIIDRRDTWWALDQGLVTAMPEVLRIIYLPAVPDEQMAQQLIANEVDCSLDLRPLTIETVLAQNPKITTHTGSDKPYGYVDWWPTSLYVNNEREPFTDKAVRWALSYYIDRDQIIDAAHAERPEPHRRQQNGEGGQNRVLQHVARERQGPIWNRPWMIAAEQGKDRPLKGKQIEKNESKQKERYGGEEQQGRKEKTDESWGVAPAEQRAEQGAEEKSQDGGCEEEPDRPGKGFSHHVRHVHWVIRQGIAEVESNDIFQIDDVLLGDRIIQPEFLLIDLDHLLHAALGGAAGRGLLKQAASDRVAPRKAGQKEIEGCGRPDDEDEHQQPPDDVLEAH